MDATDEELIKSAFLNIVHRPPSEEEMQILLTTFLTERSQIAAPTSVQLLEVGRLPLNRELPQDRLLALTMVNRLLLNLSETVSRH